MKILVTGNAGFIGSNFTKTFKKRFPEAEIIGIDDFSSGRREAVTEGVIFYEGSITNKDLLEKIFSTHKPEYVFHFAAVPRVSYSVEHPVETTDVNVTGTVTLLTASKNYGIKRFIYSSSSSIYGPTKNLPTPETEPANPQSPYALQKYTNEVFCRLFSQLYGLDTVSLRYHNVFGSGQYGDSPYSNVVAAWLTSLYFPEQKKGFIEGDGEQAKDMTFVDDVVDANILTMNYVGKFNGEAFNIAIGEKPLSINEIAKRVEEVTGKKLDLERRPPRSGDVRYSHANISKAREWFGYEPKENFRGGLMKTVKWFEERIKQ